MPPKLRGVRTSGDRSAASLVVFTPLELRPRWDAAVLAAAPADVVERYLLSTQAVRLLMGSEEYGGHTLPVSASAVHHLCRQGRIDWISVSRPGSQRPVRAFSRDGVDTYFRFERDGVEPPWHRLPPSLRQDLGIDF